MEVSTPPATRPYVTHAYCLLALAEFEIADVWEFVDEAIVHIVMPPAASVPAPAAGCSPCIASATEPYTAFETCP